MKMVSIFSGKVTDKGNLSTRTLSGKQLFIHAKTLDACGIDPKAIKYPLHLIYKDDHTVDVIDDQGNPTGETITRNQALAVFTDKATMIEAFNSEASLAIEASASLAKTAAASGLTEAQLAALLLEA